MARNDRIDKLTIRLDILHADIAQMRKRVRELEKLFGEFVETASDQISKTLIVPLLRNMINFEGNLNLEDELRLEKFSRKAIDATKLPPELEYKDDDPLKLIN